MLQKCLKTLQECPKYVAKMPSFHDAYSYSYSYYFYFYYFYYYYFTIIFQENGNGTCSREATRTATISEMEFFVTIVNRSLMRSFTTTVKFPSYLQVSDKKSRKQFCILTYFCIFSSPCSLKWVNVSSISLTYASLHPR